MIELKANRYGFHLIKQNQSENFQIYPYFRDIKGPESMWLISPQHGRSYVVGRIGKRWIVSKGNGLSYTQKPLIYTRETKEDIWGILLKQDAIRDFNVGTEISKLGIRTNRMEAVIELDKTITIHESYENKPVLLQYSVECPFRISDASFMSKRLIEYYVGEWYKIDKWKCDSKYKIASNILASNLRILHDRRILHNAISSQNLTWSLELLDFELASSPRYPYEREDYNRHVPMLFEREILHTYQIILDIAWILREKPDYNYLDSLFKNYGFLT